MGIYDRDYIRPDKGGRFGPNMRFMMPSITPAIKYLIIINLVVFLADMIMDPNNAVLRPLFAVSTKYWWQIWRLITYQFLHDGLGHIFWNMLLLFFFGPMLESMWGTKRFLRFYLICGAAGGVLYPVLTMLGITGPGSVIGASGALFGILTAAAILFPQMRVYVFFGLFPVPMFVLAIVLIAGSMLSLIGGDNAGGNAAHLAGAATGAIYILWQPWRTKMRVKSSHGKWQQKIERERNFHTEVDRILAKVHDSGINSLTKKEKQLLQQATDMEQNGKSM